MTTAVVPPPPFSLLLFYSISSVGGRSGRNSHRRTRASFPNRQRKNRGGKKSIERPLFLDVHRSRSVRSLRRRRAAAGGGIPSHSPPFPPSLLEPDGSFFERRPCQGRETERPNGGGSPFLHPPFFPLRCSAAPAATAERRRTNEREITEKKGRGRRRRRGAQGKKKIWQKVSWGAPLGPSPPPHYSISLSSSSSSSSSSDERTQRSPPPLPPSPCLLAIHSGNDQSLGGVVMGGGPWRQRSRGGKTEGGGGRGGQKQAITSPSPLSSPDTHTHRGKEPGVGDGRMGRGGWDAAIQCTYVLHSAAAV